MFLRSEHLAECIYFHLKHLSNVLSIYQMNEILSNHVLLEIVGMTCELSDSIPKDKVPFYRDLTQVVFSGTCVFIKYKKRKLLRKYWGTWK